MVAVRRVWQSWLLLGDLGVGLTTEFKAFAVRGNVVDMAVGIIVGAAFTTVVKSLVDDVIMPPPGTLVGCLDASGDCSRRGHCTLDLDDGVAPG